MKKRLLSVALLMGTMAANAQVGIGTATPHRSAELLIESNNRGLLIPNVALTTTKDKTTITNGNVQSLLVYATKAQGDITPGYYYWDISVWRRLTADADIPAIVVNQFENILKLEGDKVTNLIKNLIKANETLTVLGYDKATGTLTYTDEAGKATTVDVKGAVKSFETVTSITTDAAKGTITFKDEAGKDTVLDIKALVKANETVTTLVREEAGKYTYTNEAGTESKITVIGDLTEVIKGRTDADLYNILKQLVNVEQTLTKLVYNTTDRQLAYTDEQNATHNIDVDALVKENQTLTTLNGGSNIKVTEVKGANSISYTLDVPTASKDVAGVVKPSSGLDIDAAGNLTVNLETALNGKDLTGNDIIVVTDGKGAVLRTTALSVNEKAIKLENLGGTLNLTQLQTGNAGDVLVVDADGNVVWSAKDAVTFNSLVLNGSDLTSTVNGVGSTQTLKDKLTTEMLVNGSVTAEKLGAGKGNEGKVPVAQADGTVVYQNVSADNVDGKALTSANNLLTVSTSAGVVLKDVVLTIDQTKFELNQIGGTLQLTQIEKGGADTVLVTEVGADGKPVVKWVTKESIVTANETVTSIVDHGNGTFTYTDEKGKAVSFDGNKTTVDVTKGIYIFKDGNGTPITTIDTNAIASGYNNTNSGLTATNVQAAIDELVKKINEVANTKGSLSSTDITVTEGTDALLKDVTLAIAEGAVTTEKLAPGAVTTEKIKAGGADTVLVTEAGADGKPVVKWITKAEATTNNLKIDGNELVSTVNGVEGKTDLTQAITTPMLKDGAVTAEKLGADATDAGKVATVNVDGTVSYKEIKVGDLKDAKNITSKTITVGGEKGSTLKDVTLEITGGANDGDVLVTVVDRDGISSTKWISKEQATSNDLEIDGNELVSTVNGVEGRTDLTQAITTPMLKDGSVTSEKLNAGDTGVDNRVAVADAKGNVTYKTQKEVVEGNSSNKLELTGNTLTSTVNGKASTVTLTDASIVSDKGIKGTGITVTGGANATLKDVTLEITASANDGDVLVTVVDRDGTSSTKWISKEQATTNDLEIAGNELVSTVNGVEGRTDLTQAIITEMLKDGAVTSEKLNAGKGVDNRVAVADAKGNVTYQEVSGKSLNGKALTSGSITVLGGNQALLDATQIDVTGGKNKGDVLVTTDKPLKDAANNDVIVDGKTVFVTEWVPANELGNTVTAGNGLTKTTDGKIELGGALDKDTVIKVQSGKELAIEGLHNLGDKVDSTSDKLVVADANGVLKQTSTKDIIADAIAKGNDGTPENELKAKGIKGTGITVTGGANATLKDVVLAVTPGKANQVMVTSGDETTATWVDQNTLTNVTLDGDVTGTADSTTISKLQGKELDAKDPKAGNVLVFEGGKWVTKTPTVDASNVGKAANLTTDGIIVVDTDKTSSEGSLLKAAKLSIKAGGITANELATNAVTSEKINAGAVTPGKIEGGTNGQVLTTTVSTEGTKTVEWKTPTVNTTDITNKGNLTSTTKELLTVTDGTGVVLQNVSLTVNQDKFELNKIGGTLSVTKVEAGKPNQVLVTEGDKVTWVDNKTFVQANQEKVVVKPADGKTTGTNSNVIVTPGTNPTTGEKEYTVDVKAAMPKVFYMPPVMFDTSKADEKIELSRNLYDEYVAMFGGTGKVVDTPITGTRPPMVQSDDKATIPVYKKEDLNFFVPYYDPAVFKDVKVNADGKLTYKVIKKAKYGAFMTVVFVVK